VPALDDNSPLLTQRPWYDLLGVRYFFAMTPKDIPDAELLRTAPLYAYLNEHAMSRAFLVHQARSWRPRGAPNAIVKRLAATPGVLPPVSQVLVEGHVPETTRRASPPAPAEAVPIRRYSAEVIDLDVNAPWPGFVVISDPPYPGWTVWVDGARKPALPADYVLRAVWVDAGPHHVRWVYYPASVRVGMFVSLATLAITVGLFVAAWRPGRRPKVRRKGPGRGDDSPPGGPHAGQSD
ncbi:MAG: hypothetical protein ACE5JM_12550, partial [Armatimonadota bacterium]